MDEDLIDFPCSDSWLGFYTATGKTRRGYERPARERTEPATYSAIMARCSEPDLPAGVVKMIDALRRALSRVQLENELLKARLAKQVPVLAGPAVLEESPPHDDDAA